MTQVVDRTRTHGTGHLEKDKAGPRIYVSLSRPLKSDQQRCDLQPAEQEKAETQDAWGETSSLHETPQGANLPALTDVDCK
jgi:hypothetical protein